MYTPQRVASLLIVYTAFVAGTCAACQFLLKTTAATYLSAPKLAAAKSPTNYSRVEGWKKRQSIANLAKPAVAVRDPDDAGAVVNTLAPEREVAHAVVMAQALDNTEHNRVLASEAHQVHARHIHRRVRVPSCHVLPCERNSRLTIVTAELKSTLRPSVKGKTIRVVALPANKKSLGKAKSSFTKISSKAALKIQKAAAKSQVAAQARLKADRKIALRRFRETPAEISYRSFVGTFVPAI